MTLAVSSKHTMAGAQRVVVDDGFRLKRLYRRQRVTLLSLRWLAAQEALGRTAAAVEAIEQPDEPEDNGPNPEEIIAAVAAEHGVEVRGILSTSLRSDIVAARGDAVAAVYLNCQIDGRRYTLTELGRVFGFDRTAVRRMLQKRGLK
ncbi:hypothetical protein [Pseudaminobacter soli (ex Li et al. 2025)]|nr:hypothetical protein [Mesorhizobium soli]